MRNIFLSGVIIATIALLGLFLSKKINLLDRPGPDQTRKNRVPTLQGIFLFLGVLTTVAIVYPDLLVKRETIALFAGAGGLMLLAVIDELLSMKAAKKGRTRGLKDVLPGWFRLLIQIIIIVITVWVSGVYNIERVRNDFVRKAPIWLGIVVALGRIIVFINAINRFDGIHGQSSGLSAIGFVTIFALVQYIVLPHYTAITNENFALLTIVKQMSILLAMSAVVYTIIESKPFGLLRDAGILIYGFALGYLSLLGGAKIGTILVALSLPLFDSIRVATHRLFVMKKSPTKGDYTHLYYRLMNLGRKAAEARSFTWIWSFVMMVLMLLQGVNRISKIVIFVMMALLFFGVNIYLFWYKKYPVEYIKGNKG